MNQPENLTSPLIENGYLQTPQSQQAQKPYQESPRILIRLTPFSQETDSKEQKSQNNEQDFSNQINQQNTEDNNINNQNNQIQPKENRFIIFFTDKLRQFEDKCSDDSGSNYIIICIFIVSLMICVSRKFMPNLSCIEIVFPSYLVAFSINYYLIRAGHILPYIEKEEDNFLVKLTAFTVLATLIFLLYAFQHADKSICILIFLLSWVFNWFWEAFIQGQRYKPKEYILGIVSLAGCYLVLQPNITYAFITSKNQEEQEFKRREYIIGIIAAVLSAICTSYIGVNLKRLQNHDIITINHVICLIMILFLPVFFPIEKISAPSFDQWILMILFGLILHFIMLIFVRSIQVEKPSRIFINLPLSLTFITVFDFIFGVKYANLLSWVGAGIIVFCTIMLIRQLQDRIKTSQFFLIREEKDKNRPKTNVEMDTFVKDESSLLKSKNFIEMKVLNSSGFIQNQQ